MDDLVDDFLVFLIAGMETTAITMSIMIWFFLKNPDVARKAIDEVNIKQKSFKPGKVKFAQYTHVLLLKSRGHVKLSNFIL